MGKLLALSQLGIDKCILAACQLGLQLNTRVPGPTEPIYLAYPQFHFKKIFKWYKCYQLSRNKERWFLHSRTLLLRIAHPTEGFSTAISSFCNYQFNP